MSVGVGSSAGPTGRAARVPSDTARDDRRPRRVPNIYWINPSYSGLMPSELVSLVDASQLLGVSPERVRQLVLAGDIPGVRFGNAWAVPRDAIAARRHVSNRRGRPLGIKRVWKSIVACDVDLSNASRFRNRGDIHRYSMSSADVDHLLQSDAAMLSGIGGAIYFGEPLASDGADLNMYVSAESHAALDSLVVAVPDPLGEAVLRVVADQLWPDVVRGAHRGDADQLIAPRAAVALDLMESGDPRHWVAAENLVAR